MDSSFVDYLIVISSVRRADRLWSPGGLLTIIKKNIMQQLKDKLKRNQTSANSQFGEAAIVSGILEAIGTTNKWCLEVGAGGGVRYSNTRHLIEQEWQAILIERSAKKFDLLQKLSPNNHCFCLEIQPTGAHSLDVIMDLCSAPKVLDLMVIDIDGQEWHIWNCLKKYSARIVIIEYAPYIWWRRGRMPIDHDYIVPLGKTGQSGINAMKTLSNDKGYDVIANTECNLICIKKELTLPLKTYYEEGI